MQSTQEATANARRSLGARRSLRDRSRQVTAIAVRPPCRMVPGCGTKRPGPLASKSTHSRLRPVLRCKTGRLALVLRQTWPLNAQSLDPLRQVFKIDSGRMADGSAASVSAVGRAGNALRGAHGGGTVTVPPRSNVRLWVESGHSGPVILGTSAPDLSFLRKKL